MSGLFSKICDLEPNDACNVPMLNVQSERQFTTASSEFLERHISPSFIPLLREMIPRGDAMLGFGGCWFWNCYLHALSGEDILVDLNGTGVSLSEDSLDAQVSLRRKLVSSDGVQQFGIAVEHCSSKIEVLCAMCLSLVLHISQHPMLESEQGPQALVLCATKDQCDEVYTLLDRFGAALHLVTHNLFGAYPPMPSGKRADIVVGTVPLWESVAQLTPLAAHEGLETILDQVSGDSRRTASSTRWRPYSLGFVVQLVFLDLDLQYALGYGSMLQRLFLGHRRSALPALRQSECKIGQKHGPVIFSGLPHKCQLYCLIDGSKKGRELFYALRESRDRRGDGKSNKELARIALRHTPLPCDKLDNERRVIFPCKRKRDEKDTDSCKVVAGKHSSQQCPRLFVHNALSHSRLMLDATAFEDFAAETKRRALRFWSRFEGASCSTTGGNDAASVIDVQLVYRCQCSEENFQDDAKVWCVAETVAVITPIGDGAMLPSRTALLMQHLEDELSGQIFDGSVVQCICQCATMEHVAPNLLTMHAVFAMTAKSISQAPLFMRLTNESDSEGENVDLDHNLAVTLKHCARLRQLAVEASSNVKESVGFPFHRFLPDVTCQLWRTVLVFRRIAPNISLFCDAQNGTKPTALSYLEECCQYGKVVSYFIHEQQRDKEDGGGCVHFFVEFETHEGAKEAVRQFAPRFMGEGAGAEDHTRVKLFSNSLYYEGVAAEIGKKQTVAGDSDDGDDGDEDFIVVSLLGE